MTDAAQLFEDAAAETAATDDQLARLSTLVRRQKDAETELEEIGRRADALGAEVRRISEVDIPSILDETGLSELRLSDGTKVILREELRASTTGKHREVINRWLEANGHDDLIKDEVTAQFGKGRGQQAAAVMDFIVSQSLTDAVDRKRYVSPQSFLALIRELRGSGADVPLEGLGIMVQRRAKLVAP